MKNVFENLVIGTTGFVGSGVSPTVLDQINVPFHDWSTALTQLIIAVVTVFSLFKKKKK